MNLSVLHSRAPAPGGVIWRQHVGHRPTVRKDGLPTRDSQWVRHAGVEPSVGAGYISFKPKNAWSRPASTSCRIVFSVFKRFAVCAPELQAKDEVPTILLEPFRDPLGTQRCLAGFPTFLARLSIACGSNSRVL